jgi:hypothetical protein
MNAVQSKVSQLVALAADYGFEAGVTNISDSYVIVYINSNLRCKVVKTEAGNASVTTFERKQKLANSSLEPKLSWYKAIADRRAARVA